ncbi:MAG: hypothetical protein H0V81_16045, partial [Solirubrobacterales bacterium]|nr:hypothetical protein [Solirubrobacterales bacterium]
MSSAPRPGTLEWYADQRPDEHVLLTPEGSLSRREWEQRTDALAERLVRDHAVWPGALLSGSGTLSPDWLTLSWAAAKLGAGLIGLPPGPGTGHPDAVHVAPVSGGPPPDAVPRRFSGHHGPPDAVTYSRRGRPVRRSFTPASVAAIAPTLADLIDRLRAAPGTTLALSGPVSDPLLSFLAGVVLVGGGRLAAAQAPAAALALAAEHGA